MHLLSLLIGLMHPCLIKKYNQKDTKLECYRLMFILLCIYKAGSPSIRRASPVSVYLFPGEAPKLRPSVLEGEESDIDGLVTTAMEAHADMMSEEGSEGSTDNDDFCILEAPGMGIPVCPLSFHILL